MSFNDAQALLASDLRVQPCIDVLMGALRGARPLCYAFLLGSDLPLHVSQVSL